MTKMIYVVSGQGCIYSVRWLKESVPTAIQLLHQIPVSKISTDNQDLQVSNQFNQSKEQPVIQHPFAPSCITLLDTTFFSVSNSSDLPSAGCLPVCLRNWEQITADPWILVKVTG